MYIYTEIKIIKAKYFKKEILKMIKNINKMIFILTF